MVRDVLGREPTPDTTWARLVGGAKQRVGDIVHQVHDVANRWAAIGPRSSRAKAFGAFGEGSVICYPPNTLMNVQYIRIGASTVLGPQIALSAGMVQGQQCVSDTVVSIGDRCLIGRGSGIVGHLSIEIGDDVWTGHHVYITDQNHGFADPTRPISQQMQPERPVRIGAGSWIGHGSVILPGTTIGCNVVIGANSVVSGEIPDHSVAVGAPARVVKRISG